MEESSKPVDSIILKKAYAFALDIVIIYKSLIADKKESNANHKVWTNSNEPS